MGLKEEIAGKINKVLGQIAVKDLGVTVYIREVSVGDRILMTSESSRFPVDLRKDEDTGEEIDQYGGPKLVLVGAADAKGNRIWSNDEFDSVLALPQDAMIQIAKEVARLNGMEDDSGNSSQSRMDASPSGSANG